MKKTSITLIDNNWRILSFDAHRFPDEPESCSNCLREERVERGHHPCLHPRVVHVRAPRRTGFYYRPRCAGWISRLHQAQQPVTPEPLHRLHRLSS